MDAFTGSSDAGSLLSPAALLTSGAEALRANMAFKFLIPKPLPPVADDGRAGCWGGCGDVAKVG